MMPLREISPTVGLIVATALLRAGETSEPLVSVPMENGTSWAATATAEPELLPDGSSCGS